MLLCSFWKYEKEPQPAVSVCACVCVCCHIILVLACHFNILFIPFINAVKFATLRTVSKIELIICDHRKIFQNSVPWLLTSTEQPLDAKKVTRCSQGHTTFLSVCPQEPEIWRNKEPNLCVNKGC